MSVDPGDGVWMIVITDPRAETDRGVGIGDTAELVKRRYKRADCQPFEDTKVDSTPGVCKRLLRQGTKL
ncbi:MAG TPA: hypothetical protein VGV36_00570 [Solirubrobacteraceae bacterium]|nr:hypothetical protein [Solirubrobacteraceae bacterium]